LYKYLEEAAIERTLETLLAEKLLNPKGIFGCYAKLFPFLKNDRIASFLFLLLDPDGDIYTYSIDFMKAYYRNFETFSAEELDTRIDELLEPLSERYQKMMRLFYGIGLPRTYTLHEVGHELGVIPERISQLKRKAFQQLHHSEGVRNFLIIGTELDALSLSFATKLDLYCAGVKTFAEFFCLLEDRERLNRIPFHDSDAIFTLFGFRNHFVRYTVSEFTELLDRALEKKSPEERFQNSPVPIQNLGFSSRTYHCLMRNGITTVGTFMEWAGTVSDSFCSIRGIGEKGRHEIMEMVEKIRNTGFGVEDLPIHFDVLGPPLPDRCFCIIDDNKRAHYFTYDMLADEIKKAIKNTCILSLAEHSPTGNKE